MFHTLTLRLCWHFEVIGEFCAFANSVPGILWFIFVFIFIWRQGRYWLLLLLLLLPPLMSSPKALPKLTTAAVSIWPPNRARLFANPSRMFAKISRPWSLLLLPEPPKCTSLVPFTFNCWVDTLVKTRIRERKRRKTNGWEMSLPSTAQPPNRPTAQPPPLTLNVWRCRGQLFCIV